ncbi:hypothetical protein GCM10010403_35660 [Glycomyces rutgersensis]|uniref:Uncharacterized protein n=1 Tax=Glycomyces rutgersensis TaxID=58115 RepID=A0ABN3FZ08_9ACTN
MNAVRTEGADQPCQRSARAIWGLRRSIVRMWVNASFLPDRGRVVARSQKLPHEIRAREVPRAPGAPGRNRRDARARMRSKAAGPRIPDPLDRPAATNADVKIVMVRNPIPAVEDAAERGSAKSVRSVDRRRRTGSSGLGRSAGFGPVWATGLSPGRA